jgi:hypothetical protein
VTDKLLALLARCKCGVYLEVNNHRDFYQSVKDYLDEQCANGLYTIEEIGSDYIKAMIEKNTIIELQFYPHTPMSFYKLFDHDLGSILDRALGVFNEEETSSGVGAS